MSVVIGQYVITFCISELLRLASMRYDCVNAYPFLGTQILRTKTGIHLVKDLLEYDCTISLGPSQSRLALLPNLEVVSGAQIQAGIAYN